MVRFIIKHIPGIIEQREFRLEAWQVYDKDKMEILCVCDREDKAVLIVSAMKAVTEESPRSEAPR